MCCFSGKIRNVENTRIFARTMEDGMQFIAYAMNLDVSAVEERLLGPSKRL